MDILLNNKLPVMNIYTEVKNIHMEGTVSQIVYIWLNFFLLKKRVTFIEFFNLFSRVHSIKAKTKIEILKHSSL